MSDFRVGLVGCGGMGKGLIKQFVTIDDVKLVGGADAVEAGRQAFAEEYQVPVFATIEEMLAGVELDGVIIATPNIFHEPNTITAAAAGKHVFCEKPMSLTTEACTAMIDACQAAGVKLQIGQVLRYVPNFAQSLEYVASGQIGAPRHGMIFRYSAPKKDWNQTWRDEPKQVGHYIFEVSVHELDYMRCLFGNPVAVCGWDVSVDPESPLWAQVTTAVVEFESGAICTFVEGMYNPLGRSEVEVAGTTGAFRFNWGGAFTAKFNDGREDLELDIEAIGEGRENGNRRELREWVEAVANNTPCTIPGEEGRANIELALAILESNRRHARVTLPL